MDKAKRNDRTLKLILTALFAALIAVGAFIRIPVPVVPFTMQMMFVNLAGLILGGFYGGMSALVYLLLGLVGVPIFAHGGGPMYVFNGSFGYIVGFVFGAALCGYISHSKGRVTWKSMILGTLATFVAVYTCGLTHAYLISVFYVGTPIAAKTLIVSYFLMFLPGDILTCTATIFIAKKLLPILERQGYVIASGHERKRKKEGQDNTQISTPIDLALRESEDSCTGDMPVSNKLDDANVNTQSDRCEDKSQDKDMDK